MAQADRVVLALPMWGSPYLVGEGNADDGDADEDYEKLKKDQDQLTVEQKLEILFLDDEYVKINETELDFDIHPIFCLFKDDRRWRAFQRMLPKAEAVYSSSYGDDNNATITKDGSPSFGIKALVITLANLESLGYQRDMFICYSNDWFKFLENGGDEGDYFEEKEALDAFKSRYCVPAGWDFSSQAPFKIKCIDP